MTSFEISRSCAQSIANYCVHCRFYFPRGNPTGKLSVDAICKKFSEAFSKLKLGSVTTEQLGQVLKVRCSRVISQTRHNTQHLIIYI